MNISILRSNSLRSPLIPSSLPVRLILFVLSSTRNVVVLNDIHIDIMDYIVPAVCSETEFRTMWAEFEWENKVSYTSFQKEV